MTQRNGCLSFIVGGLVGGLIVAGIDAFYHRFNPGYIDRNEAIEMGRYDAGYHCKETKYTHPVDCSHFTVKTIYEAKDGWTIEFQSADHRRTEGMWIGRRGEYDSVGGENLDGMSADGKTENSPPIALAPKRPR